MEYAVAQKAKAAGVDMSEVYLYELDGLKHFMTRRFDRTAAQRHHVQTLSAIAHFPTSVPLNFRTYEQLFRRVVFNVAIGECDDHTKNISFMLKQGEDWALAPAYDLTGSGYPSSDPWNAHAGRHQLSVDGKFEMIEKTDLLALAERFAIGTGKRLIEEVFASVNS